MAHLMNPLEQGVLQRIWHQTPLNRPAGSNATLHLYSEMPDEDGNNGVELSTGGYVPINILLNNTLWSVSSAGVVANTAVIQSVVATADWPLIAGYVIKAASVPWIGGPVLGTDRTVENGTRFELAVGKATWAFGGGLTEWARNALAAYLFLGTVPTWPTAMNFRMTTTSPTATAAGTVVTGPGYSNLVVNCTNSFWSLDTVENRMYNAVQLPWGTAAGSWGTVVGIDVFDNANTNRWFFRALDTPRPVASGNQPRFKIGELGFTAG